MQLSLQLELRSRTPFTSHASNAAQEALSQASVLVIGAGGLGCPAAIYLAASGIGHLGIVDQDDVEISNLHRQILHTERTIGKHKADSAAAACAAINSSIKVLLCAFIFSQKLCILHEIARH